MVNISQVNVTLGQDAANVGWSEPIWLLEPGFSDTTIFSVTLPDSNGGVHVFSTCDGIIYYMRKSEEGWSEPVDIQAEGGYISAALDSQGIAHLTWVSSGTLYYSQAHIFNASDPRAWSPPQPLSFEIAGYAPQHQIYVDLTGRLHIVYVQKDEASSQVAYIKSLDGGATWSSPTFISQASPGVTGYSPRIAADSDGNLHVVWTEHPILETAADVVMSKVLYARSTDEGRIWDYREMAVGGWWYHYSNLIVSDQTIHLLWNGSGEEGGRYHCWSEDGGKNWSDVVKFWGMSGRTGIPAAALDSDGVLHLVISGDGFGRVGWIFYTFWTGSEWAAPVAIEGGESPYLSISEGNKLHITGWNEGGLWYSTALSLAPSIPLKAVEPPPIPLRTKESPSASPLPTTPFTPTPLAEAQSSEFSGIQPDLHQGTPAWFPIALGCVAASGMVLVVLAAKWAKRRYS